MLPLCNTVAAWGSSRGVPAFPSTGCTTPFPVTSKGKMMLAFEKGLEQSFLLELGKGQPGAKMALLSPGAQIEVCWPAP